MDKIKFYLPDFYGHFAIHMLIYEFMKKRPEYFYDNIEIGAVYGAFPGSIWNGGRVVLGSCKKNEIQYVIDEYNKRGIPVRYTFTNPLIEEKHVYDTFCNLCLKLGDNGMNEVLVNSEVLEEYIRKEYPNYKILSSTTKCLRLIGDVQEEAKKDYSLVVLDNSFNNSPKLFMLDHKEKFELVANSYCTDSCPRRREHYAAIGKSQLEFADTEFGKCEFINRDFYDLMDNKGFITTEDIFGRYYEAGFRHFKLDGRGFNVYKVVESYMYYLVKPEYRDQVRLALLRSAQKM